MTRSLHLPCPQEFQRKPPAPCLPTTGDLFFTKEMTAVQRRYLIFPRSHSPPEAEQKFQYRLDARIHVFPALSLSLSLRVT